MLKRLALYARLMRLDKPIGIYLLLWPTLWAVWLAGEGRPAFTIVLIFILGTVVMRSAGCVINDFADRRIDPHVKRTCQRPLATGEVSSREALGLFIALCLLAFGLVLFLNRFTILLSLIAVVLAAIYPFMKRYTHWPQFFLGLAFAWAIPMAFAAQQNSLPALAWWLLLTKILWTIAYDSMYAMVDRDDDLKIGVKSTAVLFGQADRLIIGLLQIAVLGLLIFIGQQAGLGTAYYLSLAVAALLALYQQWLIKDRRREPCFRAFLNNHWFGLVVFLGLLVDYPL